MRLSLSSFICRDSNAVKDSPGVMTFLSNVFPLFQVPFADAFFPCKQLSLVRLTLAGKGNYVVLFLSSTLGRYLN